MKKTAAFCLCLVLALMICACAEIPPASSEPNEPSATPEPTPTEAVSATPEATPTPVLTKQPTATPAVILSPSPTVTSQSAPPDYPRSTSFTSVDELSEFLLTEKNTYAKGHYVSLFQSVRSRGYFVKPVFSDEIQFRTKNGYKVAAAVSESGFEAPSVAYRLLYKDTDVLVYVHEIDEGEIQTVREHLYAYQSGKDLRESEGYTLDSIKEKGIKEKTVATKSESLKTWGKEYGTCYKIWYILDNAHLVSVEWYTTDADDAQEFVSKLEFEKVELKTGKPNLPSTPITPEAGITPIVTPPVGEIVPNA